MNKPRFRQLLLIIGVALWTFALVPAWDHNDGGGVVTNRFCMGWWNSPLVNRYRRSKKEDRIAVRPRFDLSLGRPCFPYGYDLFRNP